MQSIFPYIRFTFLAGLLTFAQFVPAEPSATIYLAADSSVENSQQNIRDKYDTTLTPVNQKDTISDLKVTTHIRKAVIQDQALSFDAHNVKIITINGEVTLRGPVETPAESAKLQKISTETPDVVKVHNQLEVKAP